MTFTREQLEVHASGRISEIFGPAFAAQDSHPRQVRMPMPPLLLADRVVGLLGEPASMRTGTIWTETDVRADSWYLHEGRMPTGILIESGQADLMLISWLGVDLHNRGDRVYRLLGCELTFHGQLPAIGETLRYEISIDGHARHGEVGLFFFHYDCKSDGELRLSVRQGQAGFFTDEELDESAGILWNPADDVPAPEAPLAGPRPGVTPASSYDDRQVAAFAEGDVMTAFGPAFLRCASHTRTPRIANGRLRLFDRVDELDLKGGPWGRGYLRATMDVTPDQWFFPGHFYNDPCMPGTLMFEGCLQTMAFYVAALGYTIDRDGWRFEPVPEQPYLLRCRGQVTPKSSSLVYEVFVSELHDGAEPMLVADLMCTVDGLRAFHCRRMALRLAPDSPLSAYDLSQIAPDAEPVAEYRGLPLRPGVAAGLRHRQPGRRVRAALCHAAAVAPRAAAAGAAVSLHQPHQLAQSPAGRHAGGGRGRNRVRHPGGRVVLRRASHRADAVVRADRSRAPAVRLAGVVRRVRRARGRRGVLPQPRWQGRAASRRSRR